MKCSHGSCPNDVPPGAYCDGNGSHPPRRAKRLTGEKKRAAQRDAEARREEERDRAERRRRVRPCFATAWDRQWLHRRGDLAEVLREAVGCGLYTHDEAARLEAETAVEVAAMDAERERKRAEHEKIREIPAGFVAPFRFDGIAYIWDVNNEMAADDRPEGRKGWRARGWGRIGYLPDAEAVMDAWTAWVAEAVGTDDVDGHEAARRMNVKAGWVEEEPSPVEPRPEPSPEPRRRTSHRGALFTVALVGALMGVGGMTGDKP